MNSLRSAAGSRRDARRFDGNTLLAEMKSGRYVNQSIPPWRIDTVDTSMEWTYGAPILQVPSASGISPLALENTIQLRLFLHDGNRAGWYYPLEKLDSPVLDLMNVRYVLTRAADLPRFAAHPEVPRTLRSLPGTELFENTAVFPRFFFVRRVQQVQPIAEVHDWIERRHINLRDTALVEDRVNLPQASASDGPESITTLSYNMPSRIQLESQSPRPALLVLSETYYPGWTAWIDNQHTPIYPVDIGLRGVCQRRLAKHQLRMEFRPEILPLSLGISLATAIVLVLCAILPRSRDTISPVRHAGGSRS